MFGWEFPPFVSGGLGVASEGLVRGLASIGAEVVLVLPRYRRPAVEAGSPSRFRVVDAGALEDRRRDAERPALTVELRRISTRLRPYVTESIYAAETASASTSAPGRLSGGYGPDLASEVMRYAALSATIARNERFDVIHAHDWLTFLAGLEARRVSGRPLAVHVHATEFDRAGADGDRFVSDVERIGMTLANRVIAVSRYTARQVESRYGIPAERVRVVHNAIDPAPPPGGRESGERQPLVLFAGRITRQKGPEQFVEAAARVARELPAVRFAVAGSGDGARPMRERVEALGLTSRFRFTGFLEPAELDELYRRADVYVMPSVSEPFGLTALEALRHGTPVIVSRDAGVSEVVANVLRFRTGDVQDLASRILSVLIYPPLSRELSARGRADVGRLSWAASARQCMELYREMLLAG
jgi:glycogen(starch) synthase